LTASIVYYFSSCYLCKTESNKPNEKNNKVLSKAIAWIDSEMAFWK